MPAHGQSWSGGMLASARRMGPLERWRRIRDRLLASPGFQRWAAGFPLTRAVARREARTLFDICAGFVYSQVLLACVRLGVFHALADGPLDCDEVAERVGLPPERALRLLRAAASLRLVEQRGKGKWGLGLLGAAFLGNPGIAAMVDHHTRLYADLSDPVSLLRGTMDGTALESYWPYSGSPRPEALTGGEVADYSALMSASQGFVSDDVLDAYDLAGHRRLLDVGGGEGTFIATAAARWPHLRFQLFDLPAVVGRARERFTKAGLAHRVEVHGGDFFASALPAGADVVTLVRVLHDHDDEAAKAIVRRARAALPDNGALVVAEPMAGTRGAEPVGDAYFGLYLLAMGSGRPRRPAELKAMLRGGGFRRVRRVATRRPLLTQLLVARP